MDTHESDRSLTLKDALATLRRRAWIGILFTVLTVGAVGYFSHNATREFRASAVVVIEAPRRGILTPSDLIESVQLDLPRYYETQYELLSSPRLVADVFKREGGPGLRIRLEDRPEFRDCVLPQDPAAEHLFMGAIAERIEIEPREDSFLVDVSFTGTDPHVTTTFVNELVKAFEQRHRARDEEKRSDSVELIKNKTKELEEFWKKARTTLLEFQRDNDVVAFEEKQQILIEGYQQYISALTKIDLDLAGETPRIEPLAKGGFRDEQGQLVPMAIALLESDPAVLALRTELRGVDAQLEGKREVLGDNHMDIRELVARREALAAKLESTTDRTLESRILRFGQRRQERATTAALVSEKKKALDELTGLRQEYEELRTRVNDALALYQEGARREAQIASVVEEDEEPAPAQASNISVENFANVPATPFKPRTLLNLILAFLVGIAGGVGLIFLIDYLDDSVKSLDELERNAGVRTLGIIPALRASAATRDRITLEQPRGLAAESYRGLRTAVRYGGAEDARARRILVTSSGPSEGKTTTAVNLAITLALNGESTLLIDGDLRRPRVHVALGYGEGVGLSDLFQEECELEEALRQTEVEGLDLLPSGKPITHPSELLGGPWMRAFLERMSRRYEHIVIDSPPVNLVTDAVLLARTCSQTVVVVRSRFTRIRALQMALEKLRQVGAEIGGVVLNHASFRSEGYYGYGRGYYGKKGVYYGRDRELRSAKSKRGAKKRRGARRGSARVVRARRKTPAQV